MNVTVTDDALKQMSTICDRNNTPVVRYELRGGGCSGLMAHWNTEPHYEPEEGEGQWTIGDNRFFVIDKFTLSYMDGATIDYTGDFMPQFKVTIPNRAACGCGESFQA
jgi:iron-sulfur cluster assembly accessory protein|tara:strand:+ start:145 stop:468 length:324 start_codon:yes stop_codon:yes gene_type:complete